MNGGDSGASWMFGATLNMGSNMAKEMNMALMDEIKTHAPFSDSKNYLGVPLTGRRVRLKIDYRNSCS